MPDYRVYLIDKNDRIISAREMTAASDEEALAIAQALAVGVDVEVWQLGRKVGRLTP
jgi:hypothetical protein